MRFRANCNFGAKKKVLKITFFNLAVCYTLLRFKFHLSNGHSPQIRENGKLLVRMCRGESHFSQKWPLANVGESGESSQKCLGNVGESGEYLPSLGL
jgi:hypothetical protein